MAILQQQLLNLMTRAIFPYHQQNSPTFPLVPQFPDSAYQWEPYYSDFKLQAQNSNATPQKMANRSDDNMT